MKQKTFLLVTAAFVLLPLLAAAPFDCARRERRLYVLTPPAGANAQLTQGTGLDWWVDLGEALLLAGDERLGERLRRQGRSPSVHPLPRDGDELFLVGRKHAESMPLDNGEVLFAGRIFEVIAMSEIPPGRPRAREMRKLPRNTALFEAAARERLDFSPAIDPVVAEVSEASITTFLEGLASFPTRFTYAENFPEVRDHIAAEMTALGLQPELDPFHIDVQTFYNVVARIEGSVAPERIHIVGAHYDSFSSDPYNQAPGGDDNGSGVAALLEIGRIVAGLDLPETVILAAFGGEEEGLYGSDGFVTNLRASGELGNVVAMLNLDMVGYLDSGVHDVLLESEEFARNEVDLLAAAAQRYTPLSTYTSFFAFGSDHVPFLDAGVPAVLSIEYGYENNPYYHQPNDTVDHLSSAFLAEIVKMNLASLLQRMNYGETGGGNSGESGGMSAEESAGTGTTGMETATTASTDDGEDGGHGCGVLPPASSPPSAGALFALVLLLWRKERRQG